MDYKMFWFKVVFGCTALTGLWIMVAGTPAPNTDIPPIDGLLSLASLAEARWGQIGAGLATVLGGFLLALTSFLRDADGAYLGCDGDGGD